MPELLVEIIKDANGRKPTPGSQVSVHYVGSLTNGTIFDSSRQRDQPFKFQIGKGMVIQGWDKGVMGMSVGQTCRNYPTSPWIWGLWYWWGHSTKRNPCF